MGRSTLNRLNRLEEAVAPQGRLHVVFGTNQADLDRELAKFEASGVAVDGDIVLCVSWMEARRAKQSRKQTRNHPATPA
jgi:hypothetical protein